MQGTRVQFLGWEDPLENNMVNPLQYSCLENSMDSMELVAVLWVAKSRTRLKQLSTCSKLSDSLAPTFRMKLASFRVGTNCHD